MASEPFDAVLAEMLVLLPNEVYEAGRAVLDRLSVAHAAEVAERDARIAYRDNIIAGHAADTREYQKQIQQSEARAETAEARVRELEAVAGYAEHRVDCRHATYAAEACDCGLEAAIATTEQAAGGLVRDGGE